MSKRLFFAVLLVIMLVAATGAISAQGPAGSWGSGITCINLDASNAASIVVSFYPEGSGTSVLDYPDTIAAGGSKLYFTPSTPPGVPAGFLGSVVVSSSTPVACSVNTQVLSSGTTADPYRVGTSAGVGTDAAAPTLYAPQLMKALAGTWNSYLAVQNASGSATNVTITYKNSAGNAIPAATETANIPAGSNKVFYQGANAGLPAGFIGAATIAADNGTSDLAVVANFYNAGTASSNAQFHSYNGFSSGANKLLVPRVVRNFYGYNGGLTIQNIGPNDVTIKATFNFSGNPFVYNSGIIKSGAALALYMPSVAELAGVDALPVSQRTGSAVVEKLTGTGPIVAIVNEDNRGGAGIPAERAGQGSTYNAIADGSQTTSLFFPQVPRNAGGVWSGGFQIANTTGTATTCTVTYVGAPGATQNNVPLAANGTISTFAPTVAGLPNGFNAGVNAVCGQAVVGISNLAVNPGSGKYGDSLSTANGLNQ